MLAAMRPLLPCSGTQSMVSAVCCDITDICCSNALLVVWGALVRPGDTYVQILLSESSAVHRPLGTA